MEDQAQTDPVFDELLIRNELHDALRAPPQGPIIFGLIRARQRAFVLALAVLAVCGCQARSSVEAAQTAIVSAQTALPAAQTAVSSAQPIVASLQGLLAGVTLQVTATPDGADPTSVTSVTIVGTDAQGRLGQVEPNARQASIGAALLAGSQYYPNATITLKVVDSSGATVASGSIAPGQMPSVQ